MLIVFGGLPGTGKTTISRLVAGRLNATCLRIDAIEQAIRDTMTGADIGASGYAVAQAIAEANLGDGRSVVVDCVNPVAASRSGWHRIATARAALLIDVEVICSDLAEHRRRVTTRGADIPGLVLPSWEAVMSHRYEAWDRPRLIVDTAKLFPAEAAEAVLQAVTEKTGG